MTAAEHIDPERLWSNLMELAKIGGIAGGGVNRQALTQEEFLARELCISWAYEYDLAVASDDVGNLFFRLEGSEPDLPIVMTGSHLDTQPTGGKFDGAFGVLAGLEAARAIIGAGIKPRRSIEIVAWLNEEGSRFAPGMMGSEAYVGVKSIDEIKGVTDKDGVSVEQELVKLHDHFSHLKRLPFGRDVLCFLEAHIEQGPILEDESIPVGAVTGIQGVRRMRVKITGEEAHAGTTPYGLRKDAIEESSRVIAKLYSEFSDIEDMRFTVGMMNIEPNVDDQNHQLKVISGNGLRPDIWEKFQARFNIPKIRELYGATEGVGALVNTHGRPGMVGRYMRGSLVVKCDLESGEPIRNSKGYCESVEIGETGLFISKLSKLATFEGYLDKQASNKKIMTDVMQDGDTWFNSGDLLTRHENNWLSFADRVGDTYRWKSENVSTMEVAAIINKYPEVLDTNVYGVEVESADGRAGMALMNISEDFDFEVFSEHVEKNLNTFQRPCFIRIAEVMKTTGTFKHQKEDLKKQGFDPSVIEDKLYFYQKGRYVEIDDSLYQRIQSGEERF